MLSNSAGFVLFPRVFKGEDWYRKDKVLTAVYLHLLLTADDKGQAKISHANLGEAIGISKSQVAGALARGEKEDLFFIENGTRPTLITLNDIYYRDGGDYERLD